MRSLWVLILVLLAGNTFAQRTITGRVSSDDGEPLPGANIMIKGTMNGTVTNLDGDYAIEIEDDNATLVFSFIGFEAQEIVVGSQSVINVTLGDDSELLEDVVVTALGIKREKKALGYSVAEVGDEAFESSKAANPMSSLSGRLSGVQINSTGQGAAGSTSVIIRGNALADGSNEPLYVVDGIPISNSQYSNADNKDGGGIDSGNGMSGIAADDIENISVLKGASATALYGSRAINGVVMITTKSGKGAQGTTIDFNSTTTIENARIYSDWQNVYGQGNFGNAPSSMQEAKDNTGMWGARYSDVNKYTDYRGQSSEYRFYDNENNFYETGVTTSNNVAINHNTESSTLRMSYSNLHNNGMLPNTEYNRNTLTLNGSTKAMNNKLELTGKISYVNENSTNAMIGNTPFSANLMGTPNNVPLSDLRNYKDPVTGLPVGFGNLNSNVYWNLYEVSHLYNKDRVMSMAQAKYNFTNDLSVMVRYGDDKTFFNQQSIWPIGTPHYQQGRASEVRAINSETNIDGMLSYNKDFADWGFTVNVGAARMDQEFDERQIFDERFSDPSMQKPGFGEVTTSFVNYNRKRINSVFSTAQLRYKNFLYLDISARNDWASSLIDAQPSYFYPSLSSSFVFTEIMDTPDWLSFGKLRASWAKVGSDTDPYRTRLYYNIDGVLHPGAGGDSPSGGIGSGTVPNRNLKPSMNESYEFGVDLKFFNNRLGLDVAYYNSKATNQIVRVATAPSAGYDNAIINAGAIQNAGVEMSLYADPVKTKDFNWNTALNYAYNENKVLSLTEGVNQLTLFETNGSVSVVARPGEEYGQIMGTTYRRDDAGNILLDENGRPMVNDGLGVIGNAYHKVMLGWVNQFQYKNWSATFVMDAKFGGEVYSQTEAQAYSTGRHQATLDRDGYDGGVWYPSVLGGQGTSSTPQEFYQSVSNVDEQFVYDASYVAIQEINLTYHLPSKLFDNVNFMRGASAGLFVRNLGYVWRATDNIDPQATFSIANGGAGVEMGNMALPTTYGFNLNIKF
ncbi:SusC/RagA family TonB-linked outer membrane protein [Carboxylicivirga mesophila]|uniref:SusC/RagA family TonB-linked outer membrane protein n=1 Tax=Carboxylicivirga mesophila TaxID=1166478 RepID=A0ABS5KE31_9BACT|nr:SusC/RagA family TonB-linked outer membrane protein [Carboxylicivirga mesophila]MBS2213300.1 SusC/RagA family TonB-linked outer membrane protein [Carboxylicivirga mesophila]